MAKQTTVLIILDGWGIGDPVATNAVYSGKTPNFDRILQQYPHGQLAAHGAAVGLPDGQMGNSEVGHTTIGAGRIVWMDLPRIDRAIETGELATNATLQASLAKIKAAGGRAHIAGLVSEGGVHAHQRHVRALAEIAIDAGVEVVLHLLTDGRDVAPRDAAAKLPAWLEGLPHGANPVTLIGRFYAMDRDNRWERIEAAYNAIVKGEGHRADDALDALNAAYARNEGDEFVTPTVLGDYTGARDGDGLFFANFRADRAREILAALAAPQFDGFERTAINWSAVTGMVSYSDKHNAYMDVLFPKDNLENTLGAVVAANGLTQFRVAETEKYPHVTFFMNGGEETPNVGEDRYVAASPKVRTYDLKPEMSAPEVGNHLVDAINLGGYDLIICNFANPDMVGHTGDLTAARAAVAAVDHELGRAVAAIEAQNGKMIVTADHGNCEVMVDPMTGGPHTAHTLNAVQFIVIGGGDHARPQGGLADLAPTILALMGIAQPTEMTGRSLI